MSILPDEVIGADNPPTVFPNLLSPWEGVGFDDLCLGFLVHHSDAPQIKDSVKRRRRSVVPLSEPPVKYAAARIRLLLYHTFPKMQTNLGEFTIYLQDEGKRGGPEEPPYAVLTHKGAISMKPKREYRE